MAASPQEIKSRYSDWVNAQSAASQAQHALAAAQSTLTSAQTAEANAEAVFRTTLDEGQTVVPPQGADHVIRKEQGLLVKAPATFLGE